MTITLYVAGKWSMKPTINARMNELMELGYKIPYNWTVYDNLTNSIDAAKLDIDGVSQCDVCILCFDDPEYEYRGTFTELGCALALKKIIIVMCPQKDAHCRTNCFFHHPDIFHVNTWLDVKRLMRNLLQR